MVYFFGFLGGLALFLYGMQLMGDGLQRAAGEKLQKILEALTGVLIVGVALGAAVTAVFAVQQCNNSHDCWFGKCRADDTETGVRHCYGC